MIFVGGRIQEFHTNKHFLLHFTSNIILNYFYIYFLLDIWDMIFISTIYIFLQLFVTTIIVLQ